MVKLEEARIHSVSCHNTVASLSWLLNLPIKKMSPNMSSRGVMIHSWFLQLRVDSPLRPWFTLVFLSTPYLQQNREQWTCFAENDTSLTPYGNYRLSHGTYSTEKRANAALKSSERNHRCLFNYTHERYIWGHICYLVEIPSKWLFVFQVLHVPC